MPNLTSVGGNVAAGDDALTSLTPETRTPRSAPPLDVDTVGGENAATGTGALAFNDGDYNATLSAGALKLNASGAGYVASGFNIDVGNGGVKASPGRSGSAPPAPRAGRSWWGSAGRR
jgi:hypothetical protein